MDETLARRAVACRDWSWQPGMLAQTATSDVPDLRYLDGGCWWDIGMEEVMLSEPDDPLPDLTDPATLGCLLALVREAYSEQELMIWCYTKAEALVAALESAPR